MENKTDSSFERSILFRVVAIIVCIIIAGISFFGLAKSYSSPESKINKETIKYLDEKKTTALELSASATAVSTLITLAPGDDGTPVANKLMDLAGYFLIVVSAIYIKKKKQTIMGALTFKWLKPLSMLALAVYFQMAYSVINARVGSIFWKQKGALLENRCKNIHFWSGNICGYSSKRACLKNDLQYISGVN